jgi:hypothetical protein
MTSERKRDPAEEREEINRHIEEGQPERSLPEFNEDIGRVPSGPARGWRLRAKKAKTCDLCEGDLWVEEDGQVLPCSCRKRHATRGAEIRLRAGNWIRGISLSFAAPPLAYMPEQARDAVEGVCAEVTAGKRADGLWLQGGEGTGKSALCAYIAQQLYPTNGAIAERVGDLLAHLRWLGAVKGESAVEQRMEKLIETPLLVLDSIDRAIRSRASSVPLALESSCASHDLIRLARIIRERQAAMRPLVVTSRAPSADCAMQLASISRTDLVRGLLGTVKGFADPFEDFPDYTQAVLAASFEDLQASTVPCSLDSSQTLAVAA